MRLSGKKFNEVRNKLSRIANSQVLLQENGIFEYCNLDKITANKVVRVLKADPDVEFVNSYESKKYNFSKYKFDKGFAEPESYYNVRGKLKDSVMIQDESLDEDIEKHDTLNPKLWNENNTLKPEVKEKIMDIVKDYTDGLEEDNIKFNLVDVKLVGSNCSYNYNKDSDLDIHLVMDTQSLNCPDNLYPVVYSCYRSIWNNNHNISFYGIPVEIFVETTDVQPNDAIAEDYDKNNPMYWDYKLYKIVQRNGESVFPWDEYVVADNPEWAINKWLFCNHLSDDGDIRAEEVNDKKLWMEYDIYAYNARRDADWKNCGKQLVRHILPESLGESNILVDEGVIVPEYTSTLDIGFTPKTGKTFDIKTATGYEQTYIDAYCNEDEHKHAGQARVYDRKLKDKYWAGLITGVKVEDQYRGYGLAKKLVKTAIDIGGYKLNVAFRNKIALKVYQDIGFVPVARNRTWSVPVYTLQLKSTLSPKQKIIDMVDVEEELNEATVKTQDQELKSNGIYSVMHDKWIKEPVAEDIPEIDMNDFNTKFEDLENKYFKLKNNLTIKNIDDFLWDLYNDRKESLAKDGEYAIGNLLFKEFRAMGYLDDLKEKYKQLRNKELSLEK